MCMRSCVCPACPRHSWGAARGAGLCGCCRWRVVPPLPPLWFFFCLVVSVAGCPGLGSSGLCPPIPSLPGRVVPCLSFFFCVVCVRVFWVSLLLVGCCPRLGVAGFGLVVPWRPFGGSCLRCRLGGGLGRLLWCLWAAWWLWAVLAPPPLFFFSGEGGLLVPPSASHRLAHALVGILCGFPVCCWWLRCARPCPGPIGRVGYVDYVHVWLGARSCRVRFWLRRVGGCARRLHVALG